MGTLFFAGKNINTEHIRRIFFSSLDAPDLVKVTYHYPSGESTEEKEVWTIELQFRTDKTADSSFYEWDIDAQYCSCFYEYFEDKKKFNDRVAALFLFFEENAVGGMGEINKHAKSLFKV